MTIKNATPYLILKGKAAEAIPFYEKALGAKTLEISRFGEMDQSCPDSLKDWVMHAALQVGEAMVMLSDGSPKDQPSAGGTVNVALQIDSAAQAHAIFDGLSQGGTIVERLTDAPWGALFGALQDRYGINWMFNAAKD